MNAIASVNICLYDVNFFNDMNNHYTILQFTSPIILTDAKTGNKKELDVDNCKSSLLIYPNAYLRPILKNVHYTTRFNNCERAPTCIISLDEYLFFHLNPAETKSRLKINLYSKLTTPEESYYELHLNIKIKNELTLELVCNKILKRWKHHIEEGHKFTQRHLEFKQVEEVKLEQNITAMKKLVEREFNLESKKIQKLKAERGMSFESVIPEQELKSLFFECEKIISSLSGRCDENKNENQ
nr:MAG: hypothetical protein [Porcellio scaber clopovirus]